CSFASTTCTKCSSLNSAMCAFHSTSRPNGAATVADLTMNTALLAVIRWVKHRPIRLRYRHGAQRCWHWLARAHTRSTGLSMSQQVVGNDAAMTTPPDCLRTHHSGNPVGSGLQQRLQRLTKFIRQRVIGIVMKTTILPPRIRVKRNVMIHRTTTSQAGVAVKTDMILG